MSTTGSGDKTLKSSIQKCPAIDVTPTHSAPAETRRFVSRLYDGLRGVVIPGKIAQED